VGDYFAGPNHVLPTNGTARFFSPLSVDHFVKKTSVIAYSREALARDGQKVITLAKAEGLTAHAAAISVRLDQVKEGGKDA
jgi:histidinol dehydrogenase